jgi:tRNA (guanine37-N1)-methyltransferase
LSSPQPYGELYCVEVPSSVAEEAIRVLRSKGLLARGARASKVGDGRRVRIPVPEGLVDDAVAALEALGVEVERCRDTFRLGSRGVRYVDLLRGRVPEEVLALLPRSYQVVGDLALIHLPDEALPYGRVIGEALARVARARAVFAVSVTEGEFRVRRVLKLWGEGGTETVHREYGVRIYVDISKSYFNPTLSYEHWRVSEEVRDGERVLDLFSGVGGFSLHIAFRRHATCVAVDSNPHAIVALVRSTTLNRLRGRIVPVISRVEELGELLPRGSFSRAIVDLPHRSLDYLDLAASFVERGGYIHLYVLGGEDPSEVVSRVGRASYRLVELRRVLDYAPRRYVYGVKLVKE